MAAESNQRIVVSTFYQRFGATIARTVMTTTTHRPQSRGVMVVAIDGIAIRRSDSERTNATIVAIASRTNDSVAAHDVRSLERFHFRLAASHRGPRSV